MSGIIVCALLLLSSLAGDEAVGHVRSGQAQFREWLSEGYERSATFKGLVDDIDGLPGIVYIDTAVRLSPGINGALLHTVAGSREMPLLRVVLRSDLGRTVGIATLAHELQHVVEVLHAGRAIDSTAMTSLFRSIDNTQPFGSNDNQFETQAARDVQVRVVDELGHKPRR